MLQFGPYEVREELGRGGMGIVYRGFDPIIRRDVALKTIKLYDIADDSERRHMQERLEREAQSAGRLSHPNIVTIYQVGYAEMRPGETVAFIAMEYVPGRTLASLLDKVRAAAPPIVLKLLRQAAEGLDYAHSQGVIHRDVKPANLLITADGRLKITDFGVAKLVSHTMTMTGAILGSPFYMSPEQIRAERVDGRSDQYSLAVVAYEVFGGRKPFFADTLSALVYKIAHEEPPLLMLDSAALASRLNPVLLRAMAKDPGARFPSCAAFIDALEAACAEPRPAAPAIHPAGVQPAAPPPPPAPAPPIQPAPVQPAPVQPAPLPHPPAAPPRKLPVAAIAAALGVVAVVVLGVRFLKPDIPAAPEPPAASSPAVQPEPSRPVAQAQPADPPPAQPSKPAPEPAPVRNAAAAATPAAALKTPALKTAAAPAPRTATPAPAAAEPAPAEPAKPEPVKTAAAEPAPPPPAPAPAREPVRTPPRLLERAPAPYTNEARAQGIQGAVGLSVDIDERGIPVRARILKSLDPGLDRNAIQSLAGWRFQPATEDGKPVPATVNVEIQFSLIGAPSKAPPSLKKSLQP